MRIDPWASTQFADYTRLREEFGISPFSPDKLSNPHKLLRRGVVFGQRGFELIEDAILSNKPWVILTGLVPSGRMHIGHKMVIDQVIYYQSLGADIFLAVADIEALGARGLSLKESERYAIDEYIVNYIALGLRDERCQIYFQSKRVEVKDLGYILARKVNLSDMRAIYGFDDSTNMTHVLSPLIQVGDILHVQLEKYGGARPTLVPVGVDQDPHIRLTRDIVSAHRLYNVTETKDGKIGVFVKVNENVNELLDRAENVLKNLGYTVLKKIPNYKALYILGAVKSDIAKIDEYLIPVELEYDGYTFYSPSSTYHRFMTGLTGGKMSSSQPDSSIFLTDAPQEAARKIRNCKTGGRVSLEEQRKFGGEPGQCTVYELFLYHLIERDEELDYIYESCKSGERMCGDCKKFAIQLMEKFLSDLRERRDEARERIKDYIRDD